MQLSVLHFNATKISDSQFTSLGSRLELSRPPYCWNHLSSHCAPTKIQGSRPAHGLRCASTASWVSTCTLLTVSSMWCPQQVLDAKVCVPSTPFMSRAVSLLFALLITSKLLAVALSFRLLHVPPNPARSMYSLPFPWIGKSRDFLFPSLAAAL
jgi:hypothetical protein